MGSAAIPLDNPERVRAEALEIPIISRANLLALLLQQQKCIYVAGTHGKTTVTSLLANVFKELACL